MRHMPGAKFWKTERGWSNADSFVEWLKFFDAYLTEKKKRRPQLLIMDGVGSHISFKASTFAKSVGIEIFVIIPNSSSMSQPLDLSYMASLKTAWRSACREYQFKRDNVQIKKFNFPAVMQRALDITRENPQNLIKGFKMAGIFPYDADRPYHPDNEVLYKGDPSHQRIQDSLSKLKPDNFELRKPKRQHQFIGANLIPTEEEIGAPIKSQVVVTIDYTGKRTMTAIKQEQRKELMAAKAQMQVCTLFSTIRWQKVKKNAKKNF